MTERYWNSERQQWVYPSDATKSLRRKLHRLGGATHHIDGDPLNNSPENLRIVDTRENRGGELPEYKPGELAKKPKGK